jgi:hypothetical protein
MLQLSGILYKNYTGIIAVSLLKYHGKPPDFTARLLFEEKIPMLEQTVWAGQSDNRRERCI